MVSRWRSVEVELRANATWLAALVPALVVLAAGAFQLTRPNVLFGIHSYDGNGYDDGVYFGAAVRLVHLALPYRDFVLVHPPGIAIVMAPIALLARVFGTRDGLAVARCLTVGVAAGNAVLVALAVRHKGTVAMLVAGVGLALFPLAVTAEQTVLLEPYLVLFCLLGILAIFPNGEIAPPRRVFIGGLVFGFAGLIKVWAIFPVLPLIVVCVPLWKVALRPLALGLVAGFGAPALPFFVLAPKRFIDDVLVAQIGRGSTGRLPLSAAERILQISGLSGLPALSASTALGVAVAVAFTAVALAVYVGSRRTRNRLDWFVLGALVVVVAAMFQPPEFFDHYAYFSAVFVVLVLAVCVARVAEVVRGFYRQLAGPDRRVLRMAGAGLSLASALVVVGFVIPQEADFTRTYLSPADDPGLEIAAHIDPGSCVLFDVATLAVHADRFAPASSDCPDLIDPFGMWFVENDEKPPPAPPPFRDAFVQKWRTWLERADNVVLSVQFSNFIPWTPELMQWFQREYVLVFSLPRVFIYQRVGA